MPRAKLLQGSPDEVETAYYDALARADLTSLMALWAEEEDIICIHPGAVRLVGRAAIRNSWEEILSHGGLRIQSRQLYTAHTMTMAMHNVIEDIQHTEPVPRNVHVIATNIYMKAAHGWCIVARHASIAPGPAPMESFAETMLH
ncbi:MAG: nuclear transport factor 2 family protein [Herbaspirillum sp.]